MITIKTKLEAYNPRTGSTVEGYRTPEGWKYRHRVSLLPKHRWSKWIDLYGDVFPANEFMNSIGHLFTATETMDIRHTMERLTNTMSSELFD